LEGLVRTKLLLDEQITPTAAVHLRQLGHDVVHVRDRGMIGASDSAVFRLALDEDRALVTVNVRDFVHLARRLELHPGVVLIAEGQYDRARQVQLLGSVVSAIEALEADALDLVNRALYVDSSGVLRVQDMPPE
jgi:predicted nuclease of predicted toxin-antitoxin system